MEAKLRAGDAELLSWFLATPLGATLYGLSRGKKEAPVGELPGGNAS
jgi:hypothetical protein